jgi:hypothetical protein
MKKNPTNGAGMALAVQQNAKHKTKKDPHMKNTSTNRACLALAVLAAVACCSTARADIGSVVTSTTLTAWPAESSPIFYKSISLSASLSSDGPPAIAAGSTAASLSETFTIATGAGIADGAPGPVTGNNYILTGVGMMVSGYSTSVPNTLHIYDVTTNLTSNNGSDLNGSGASYNLYSTGGAAPIGDLLGEDQGLGFINAADSGAEHVLYLGLQNGPSTYGDEVVLQSGHTYALEVSVPTGGGFDWFKGSTADTGGQAMGSTSAPNPAQSRLTITALGQAGGAPRTFAIALYGSVAPANLAPSVNGSTNIVVTTNVWIDQFNSSFVTNANNLIGGLQATNIYEGTNDYAAGYITNIWANWFGGALTSAVWDNTMDAQTNGNSGSMMLNINFNSGSQIEVWDQGPGNTIGNPFGANGLTNAVTSFQCDVLFGSGSASQTVATQNGGNPFYGYLQFGSRSSGYGQANWNVGGTDGAGGTEVTVGNNNWVHVNLPLNPNSLPSGAAVYDQLIHIYGPEFAPALTGTSTLWVDNIKFKALVNTTPAPPPTMGLQVATPELRIFAGSSVNTYDREELDTFNLGDESWVNGSFPVTYSFTLLDFPIAPGMQCHIFLVPTASLPTGNAPNGNEYQEYQASNDLWLQINGGGPNGAGGSGYNVNVSWKTNTPNANPNNVAVTYTSTGTQSPVGTWTLTFNTASSGTLTPPGVAPLNFTISDTNLMNDFAAPVQAAFGLQPNSAAGEGTYIDYANIIVKGTANPINDNFLNQPPGTLITGTAAAWDISDSANQSSEVLVTSADALWATWTVPAFGYGLAVTPIIPVVAANFGNVTGNVAGWVLPEQYNGYNTSPATNDAAGGTNWSLIPANCLPSYEYPNLTNAYFEMTKPPPPN